MVWCSGWICALNIVDPNGCTIESGVSLNNQAVGECGVS